METEDHEDIPLPAKRGSRWPILLSVMLLLVLLGTTVVVFVGRSDQDIFRSANTVRDLPTSIHWQRAFQSGLFSLLVAAPSNPALLYLCSDQNDALTGSGFAFARSTDAGIHWRVLITSFPGNAGCQVAVNPTNANDLYLTIFSISENNSSMETSSILKHSSDGGQTWATIAPVLMLSATPHVAWNGLDVGFVGRRLFATQILNGASHLISSPDSGQTWTVVDRQLLTSHQELLSYAVDPSAPSTIYELVGPIVTFGVFVYSSDSTPTPIPTPVPLPPGQLYKTTDGGITWQKLLSSVPYEEKIQLATANPHLLYLGGLSYERKDTFQMQVSRDSGATWQTVSLPAHTPLLSDWFVDATGLLYDTAKYIGSPRSGNQWLAPGSIQRYNPSTDQWSLLNVPTDATLLLTITPASSNHGDILWMTNFDGELYRGTA